MRHDRPAEGGPRVPLLVRLRGVDNVNREVLRDPLGPLSGGRDVAQVRVHELAGPVLQRRHVDAVRNGVVGADVADGPGGRTDDRGHAGIPVTSDSGRPVDRDGVTYAARPGLARVREQVRERVGRSRAIGTVCHGDREVGQMGPRIQRLDPLVTPVRDPTLVDRRDDLGRQLQMRDSGNVERHRDPGQRPGNLHTSIACRGLARGERRIGRTEVDGAIRDLGDSSAGADRAVGHGGPGLGLEVRPPLGHQRVHERGARPGDRRRVCAGRKSSRHRGRRRQREDETDDPNSLALQLCSFPATRSRRLSRLGMRRFSWCPFSAW